MPEWLLHMLNLPRQASTVANEIDWLHLCIILTTTVGAIAFSLAAVVFVVQGQRRKAGAFHAGRGVPPWMEAGAVAGLLAFFFVLWIIGYKQYVRLFRPPSETIDVYVVGKQWMWSFAYADGATTQHDLYVPVGTPVRLLLTSRDVIHSFFVPAFRVKHDVVPGQMSSMWFEATEPGAYELLCTEYCGLSHSKMRGRVIVLEVEEYQRWKRGRTGFDSAEPAVGGGQPAGGRDLASMGERVAAERGCLRCHTMDGTPHLGPTWAGVFGSVITLATGEEMVVDEAYLTRSMMDPLADIRKGFEAIMPSYMGQLSPSETAALVQLIRDLRDEASDPPQMPLPRASLGKCDMLPEGVDAGVACPDGRPARTEAEREIPDETGDEVLEEEGPEREAQREAIDSPESPGGPP